ncbi:MAG: adenylate/guanylate cyclase domain-containing protein [Candidatus Rifleibacteriota bacterium]
MTAVKETTSHHFTIRHLIGIFLPVAYSVMILLLVQFSYNRQQEASQLEARMKWQEKAQLVIASMQSQHELSHLIRNHGNILALKFENSFEGKFSTDEFLRLYKNEMESKLPAKPQFAWVFSCKNGKAKALDLPGFENTRKRVMEKVFDGFLTLSKSEQISTSEISKINKFIKGVLGPWSAPSILGQFRQGEPTPVSFEKENYYAYWRKFSSEEQDFAGIFLLYPARYFKEKDSSLKYFSDLVFRQTGRKMAAAFIPDPNFQKEKEIILPADFDNFSQEKSRILKLLGHSKNRQASETNQIQELEGYVLLRSIFNIDSIYDVVIFAPLPDSFKKSPFPFILLMTLLIIVWFLVLSYFRFRTGRWGLPMFASFRLFFFLSGVFPVTLMLIVGADLTKSSLEAEISEVRQKNLEILSGINERSDQIVPMFSHHIARFLARADIEKAIQNTPGKNFDLIFNALLKEFKQKDLDLSFLFVFSPGHEIATFLADQRMYDEARMMSDMMASSVYQNQKRFSSLYPAENIILKGSQKNWNEILKDLGNDFIESVFSTADGKATSLNSGKDSSSIFYSSIMLKDGMPDKFLVFVANSEKMFRSLLKRELDTRNSDSSTIFLAAEERSNSDFTLFPFKKMNVLNSKEGRRAFNFIKMCRGSIFQKEITTDEHIFIFYPMSKMKKYATGCLISLSEANLRYQKKHLFLISLAVIILILMYLLAAFATSYLLNPIKIIAKSLRETGNGDLSIKAELNRKDELGLLSETINLMIRGFIKRIKLGKFVSGTLEKSVSKMTDASSINRPQAVKGTVLFSDIRNFTTLSETYDPARISAFLNNHLDAMVIEIQNCGGQVEQFIGDAIVAVFIDESENRTQNIIKAIDAAKKMRVKHLEIQNKRKSAGLFTYEIGIGLDYGNLTTGTLVSEGRSEFTILGEAKSVAEKLEGLSKKGKGSKIVVSPGFLDLVDENIGFDLIEGSESYEIKFN